MRIDFSRYDPEEVDRLHARPKCHGARMRFAIHASKVCPTHVWQHFFFARYECDDLGKLSYLRDAITAWDRQLQAERDGTATRRRDRGEKALCCEALYQYMKVAARLGDLDLAAWAIRKLIKLDPQDKRDAVAIARHLGVYPVVVAGTDYEAMRM